MLQRPAQRIILASASASRRALLTAAGLNFDVQPAEIDEDAVKQAVHAAGWEAEIAALRLAELKAAAVARQHPAALVIGADQILVCEGRWFDKPPDLTAAERQLLALRGRSHVLVTAVVCCRGDQVTWSHVAGPRLTMREFSTEFLHAYLAAEGRGITGSVGAYRLEGLGIHLFSAVTGEFSAVLGLPLLPLLHELRATGYLIT